MSKRSTGKGAQDLKTLMDSLADRVVDLSDSEFSEEVQGEGVGVESLADSVRNVFDAALKNCHRGQVRHLEESFRDQLSQITGRSYELPVSPAARRELLRQVVRQQGAPSRVAAFDKGSLDALSDSEVERLLIELWSQKSSSGGNGESGK
jgi:hypothetical protein